MGSTDCDRVIVLLMHVVHTLSIMNLALVVLYVRSSVGAWLRVREL